MRHVKHAVFLLTLFQFCGANADSFWKHNGSLMRLVTNGSSKTFLYERPRRSMVAEGVRAGTVLFEGNAVDSRYKGTAYIFSARCGKRPYSVDGQIELDGKVIELGGKVPRVDPSSCRDIGSRDDSLRFDFLWSDLQPVDTREASLCLSNDISDYKACLEKEGNKLCKQRSMAIEDLMQCFRVVVDAVHAKSGMTGTAQVVANGPFICCDAGSCRLCGGGPSPYCQRVDADRVRDCDGDVMEDHCTEVVCPVRECKMVCSKPDN